MVSIPQSLKNTIAAFKKQNLKIATLESKKNKAFDKYLSSNKDTDKKKYRILKKEMLAAEKVNEVRADKILTFSKKNNINPTKLF